MFVNSVRHLEKQVSRNLKHAGIKPRPVQSNGLWCHTTIPSILILYNMKYEVGLSYKLTTVVSVGILLYSILLIVFVSISKHTFKKSTLFSGTTACSFICTMLMYYYFEIGVLQSFLMSWTTICLYSCLIRYTLYHFPQTFTLGEAGIITQGIVLSTFMTLTKIFVEEQLEFISCTVFSFIFSIVVIITLLHTLRRNKKSLKHLIEVVVFGAMLCLSLLHGILGKYYFIDFLYFLFFDIVRIKIFLFWLLLLATSVIIVYINTQQGKKADTINRKSFHILGALVFMTGILFDVQFMTLSAGLAFGVLIFVEALRKSSIEPLAQNLQSAFIVYSDEKDIGSFAMTPIYLFIGLSCPLLLVPEHDYNKLELLSGVLTIGIGDTFASWSGKKFGIHKWPDSERTIEGTMCNILSQLFIVYVSYKLDFLTVSHLLVRSVISATITGLIEAKLEQVDNLLLPLCNILILQMISFVV